jgi:hypothetical protein
VDEIGKLLPALFMKQIGRADPHLLEILTPLWPRIVGKMMAQHSHPAAFACGVLTLHTGNATWSVQLRHMTAEICAEINGFLGRTIVQKLRIKRVAQYSSLGSDQPPGPAASLASTQPGKTINTDFIADPEIAAALATSFAKYFSRPGRS